jgi:hypothetical protein
MAAVPSAGCRNLADLGTGLRYSCPQPPKRHESSAIRRADGHGGAATAKRKRSGPCVARARLMLSEPPILGAGGHVLCVRSKYKRPCRCPFDLTAAIMGSRKLARRVYW